MPFQKKNQTRLTVLSVFMIFVLLLYAARMYSVQIIHAAEYTDKNDGAASVRTAVLKARRGEILDCYGRQIAVNRDGYNVVFNRAYVKNDSLNNVILTLIKLFEKQGVKWKDEMPLNMTAPYGFKEGESTDKLISKLKLAHYATAKNCLDAAIEKYKLEDYTPDEQRKIAGVRYGMDIADFSISYPYTFAEDIPTELMRKVSEAGFMLSGVSVEVVPFREYPDTSLAVNLIGTVGPIFAEDWEEYKKNGYSYDDKVGKSGIEKWGEDYLRGTDGEITYRIDQNGNIISSEVTKEPVAGKTVMLTLDKKMQRRVQDSIANTVKELQSKGGTAVAGAAVAIHIESGKIICAANYPTYDSATLGKNYEALTKDPVKPLTDRAFQGVYPIGSTIKPAVAVAAMENGLYRIGETVNCVMTYRYFDDYKPNCMHYHGPIALKNALAKSCNYFFFEMGKRIGATRLTDYFKQFGLGVATGVEVDDSKGILKKADSNGGGDTLQFAIGQLNAFTPLQLCNYVATLSNGGTHYRASLISKIVSYDMSETFDESAPEVMNKIKISDTTLNAVKEGMLSVTEDGTGRATLGNYPIKVGGKTGTAQVNGKADHSLFVAFAPFENPEIAISVVLENGASGFAAGGIVKDILDAYFYGSGSADKNTVPFTVLN